VSEKREIAPLAPAWEHKYIYTDYVQWRREQSAK